MHQKFFPFKTVEEQKRFGRNHIEKRHFKFSYDSPINDRPFYILLDVLFENNHYEEIIQKEIQNDLLLTSSESLTVSVPSESCILADKLTAFAPHTTGILLNNGKDMEVMKQFYDVSSLLDIFTNFQQIARTYRKISYSEMAYRGINKTHRDCLNDTFEAALCIASRGKVNKEEYPIYVKGIRELKSHIYAENFTPEIAALRATKIMYMVMCLLANTEYVRVEDSMKYLDKRIEWDELASLRYMKKIDPEAYAYVIKTDRLLRKLVSTNIN